MDTFNWDVLNENKGRPNKQGSCIYSGTSISRHYWDRRKVSRLLLSGVIMCTNTVFGIVKWIFINVSSFQGILIVQFHNGLSNCKAGRPLYVAVLTCIRCPVDVMVELSPIDLAFCCLRRTSCLAYAVAAFREVREGRREGGREGGRGGEKEGERGQEEGRGGREEGMVQMMRESERGKGTGCLYLLITSLCCFLNFSLLK